MKRKGYKGSMQGIVCFSQLNEGDTFWAKTGNKPHCYTKQFNQGMPKVEEGEQPTYGSHPFSATEYVGLTADAVAMVG